ncbi:MAG: hypothetical protein KAS32_13380 [Candidatus Peribacteraceae bacterium]|nr:hypothetical protein [Candidatus Peribacteraceae bacterium]
MATKKEIWLRYFLDDSNPATYMNRTQSAMAAKYNAKSYDDFAHIGANNFKRCKKIISKWLDEQGLSEAALKTKLITLLDAKETKFFAYEGVITDEREVNAIETQRRSLDMAFKVKGTYAAEKKELSGPGGGPIQTEGATITAEMSEKQAAEIYARLVKGTNG